MYRILCVSLLVGLTNACESMMGPDSDNWFISLELQDAHEKVKAIAAAPNADSRRTVLHVNDTHKIVLAENICVGFSFPFLPQPTTSIELSGSYGEDGGSAVLFSGLYVARLDVESTTGESFDFAEEIQREKDEFGFFVFFSPPIVSGEAIILTRARCVQEGEATLTLKWADVSFSSNDSVDFIFYRGETHLKITCSKERPAPL